MPASFKVTKYGIIGNLTGSVQGTASYAITASYVPGIPDVSIFVASASYSTSDKKIYFYSSTGSQLAFIDATDFIKDGMVDTVTINTGSNQMIITFNTDAGKEDIELSLTDIFNPSNYYDKDDVDLIISGLPRGIEAITFNDTPASVSDGTASISYAFVEEDPIYLADSASLKASASVATSASEWITANSGNLGKSPFIPGTGSGSAVLSGSGATATGQFAVAEGKNTIASGSYSHAEGTGSVAIGNYSHAEGRGTTASGTGSHAEGTRTTASGHFSHAEGTTTKASGDYSHAEGSYATASGHFSHAEGGSTVALNQYEHAAGKYNAKAFGQIFSIGVGDAEARRKNAISVVAGSNPSASVYIYGVGGYDGTNPTPGENDIASFLGIAPLEAIDALFVEGGGGGSSS